ncbi:MAG TPA: hypothetical protein VK814_15985 [Acidobacteriaceae bacterium]|nr:hypothetical protein [Acidobacteriaceae bacterium]
MKKPGLVCHWVRVVKSVLIGEDLNSVVTPAGGRRVRVDIDGKGSYRLL